MEQIRIDGNAGDDQISTQTPTLGTLNGNDGSDTIFGGSMQDLITGGAGIDFLFGGNGDDVLLSDQRFGTGTTVVDDFEVLNGGAEDSLDPGDVCIQLGDDAFVSCEVIGDGGGRKDVLTWLRAIIIPVDAIVFNASDPFLAPFGPVLINPVMEIAVTERSQIPNVSALAPTPTPRPQSFAVTDVNADGQTSPADALLVINHLSRAAALGEDVGRILSSADSRKDVNGNGQIEPRDALMVINELARQSASRSEGEDTGASQWIPAVDSVFSDGPLDLDDDEDGLLGTGLF